MSTKSDLERGLKKKQVLLKKTVKALSPTHPQFKRAVRALVSNSQQIAALRRGQQ